MRRLVFIAALVLASGGCVFEDRCTNGAVRDEASGRCVLEQRDGGSDAGDRDAGDRDGGTDPDGGDPRDGGTDGGGPRTIVDVAVGAAHVCVVDSEGELICWGANQLGQLATGDISPQAAPRRIDLGARVIAVAGNTIHSCAQTAEPGFYCWGTNDTGQIGNGTASPAPVTTPFRHEALGAARHFAGSFANTCFVSILSRAVCWGRNDSGQVGIGAVTADVTAPDQPVERLKGTFENAVRVAIADRHVCFLDADGTVLCMGNNDEGAVGNAGGGDVLVATPVPGMSDATSISVSASHSCAVHAGEVYCWGDNSQGQVQPGGAAGPVWMPTRVDLGSAVRQVVTGDGHACALMESGEVMCWGSRAHGAVGDGMPASDTQTGPVMVTGANDVARLDASYLFLTCALTNAGALYCWGEDASALVGGSPGSATVFLDGETLHVAPVRVDPFGG